MNKIEKLKTVIDYARDIHSASEGTVLPELVESDYDMLDRLADSLQTKQTTSTTVLSIMQECMTEDNAGAPDGIAEVVCERLQDLSDQKLNEIYDAVHMLASVLVAEPGKYM